MEIDIALIAANMLKKIFIIIGAVAVAFGVGALIHYVVETLSRHNKLWCHITNKHGKYVYADELPDKSIVYCCRDCDEVVILPKDAALDTATSSEQHPNKWTYKVGKLHKDITKQRSNLICDIFGHSRWRYIQDNVMHCVRCRKALTYRKIIAHKFIEKILNPELLKIPHRLYEPEKLRQIIYEVEK